MEPKRAQTSVDRRGFLRTIGSGAAGATAAAGTAALVPTGVAAAESKSEQVKSRYRETDHVKAYYRTNRY